MGVGAMAEPASFDELEQQIEAVLEAETTDFFELAAMLSLDPKQDFVGADLSGVDLSGKDLSYANFTRANLRGANLSDINLEGADFTDADLSSPLLLDVANTFQTGNPLHRLSNLSRALSRARDLAITLTHDRDFTRDHDLVLALAHEHYLALDLVHDLSLALARTRTHTLTLALARTRAIAHDLALARDLARDRDFNNIIGTLSRLRCQHLGTTFKGVNLQNVCWDGAHLDGTLISNCQGLTPEDISILKRRGVIFDDAPGERSPVVSPRSPVPV
jgi:uncharacterized protein YjbI with pentapeptide repeats